MTREVLQQALEALVTAEAGLADIGDADREPTDDLAWCEERASQALVKPRAAIAAVKAALAQPEQEPLEYWNAVEGWVKIDDVREHFDSVGCGTIYKTAGEDRVPLYTTPPQREWVGLTEDESDDIFYSLADEPGRMHRLLSAAIEAKLKAKNI
jgi:hypothetical protein